MTPVVVLTAERPADGAGHRSAGAVAYRVTAGPASRTVAEFRGERGVPRVLLRAALIVGLIAVEEL
jgi:hypothetical protein